MPRTPKYPLEPLLEHRDRKVEGAAAELGEAMRAREAAEGARAAAERALRDARSRADAVRGDEATRLAGGGLRAVDLARAEAWERVALEEMHGLALAEANATARVSAARDAELAAQGALAERKAERDAVAKDEANFVDRARRAIDATDEEEAAEAWASKQSGE